jgi:hypothetical protein
MDAHFRVLRDPERIRGERPLSNRPHMTSCAGCGERVTKRSLYSYRAGKRSKFCVPCTKRRATERECTSCGETKLTSEFFEGLNGVSPHCRSCRDKREREKRCSKCGVTKPAEDFNKSGGRLSGWCKPCKVDAQRERRKALKEHRELERAKPPS